MKKQKSRRKNHKNGRKKTNVVPKKNQETKMVIKDQSKIDCLESEWWWYEQLNGNNRLKGNTFSL